MICRCGHSVDVHSHGKSCTHSYFNGFQIKFCKCELFALAKDGSKQLNSDEQGEQNVMAKEKKGKKVVLFEVTSKNGDEMLAKENMSNAAIFYRVLVAKGEAMTRVAIYEASKSKCESQAAYERLGDQTHDTLARLRKAGLVKRIETREEVKATAKPRAARKPRAAKKRAVVEQPAAEASAAA